MQRLAALSRDRQPSMRFSTLSRCSLINAPPGSGLIFSPQAPWPRHRDSVRHLWTRAFPAEAFQGNEPCTLPEFKEQQHSAAFPPLGSFRDRKSVV